MGRLRLLSSVALLLVAVLVIGGCSDESASPNGS
jgi:hypothetical protein